MGWFKPSGLCKCDCPPIGLCDCRQLEIGSFDLIIEFNFPATYSTYCTKADGCHFDSHACASTGCFIVHHYSGFPTGSYNLGTFTRDCSNGSAVFTPPAIDPAGFEVSLGFFSTTKYLCDGSVDASGTFTSEMKIIVDGNWFVYFKCPTCTAPGGDLFDGDPACGVSVYPQTREYQYGSFTNSIPRRDASCNFIDLIDIWGTSTTKFL